MTEFHLSAYLRGLRLFLLTATFVMASSSAISSEPLATPPQIRNLRLAETENQTLFAPLDITTQRVFLPLVNTYRGLIFSQDSSHFDVRYMVGDKWVHYVLNRATVKDFRGYYAQFISGIFFDDKPIAATIPYDGGLAGLVLLKFNNASVYVPRFQGNVEFASAAGVTIRYTSLDASGAVPAGKLVVRMVFEPGNPYLQIRTEQTPTTATFALYSWTVFPVLGGKFDPKLRVVLPYDQARYYVINGQARGIHYFPRIKPWSLRMGAEGTLYSRITAGFFYSAASDARPLVNGWPMGHDYCAGLDSVPYNLDRVFDRLYLNYQEDEAGYCAGGPYDYAWQNADNAIVSVAAGQTYRTGINYWIGEDDWRGTYGLNSNSTFQFVIDKLYLGLAGLAQPKPAVH